MSILPFRRQPSKPQPAPAIRFRVELVKGEHKRLFEIRPNVGGWQSWMRHDGEPLRALMIYDRLQALATKAEYEREIAALRADGWT
jgi:hypothetical protein